MTGLLVHPGRSLAIDAFVLLTARLRSMGWKRARLSAHASAQVRELKGGRCEIMWCDSNRWPFRAPTKASDPVVVFTCDSRTLQVFGEVRHHALEALLQVWEDALPP